MSTTKGVSNKQCFPGVKIQREYSIQDSLDRFSAIYFSSFPKGERVALSKLISTIQEKSRWLFTVRSDSQLIGFATTIPLFDTDMHFLEYIAINRSYRCLGAGRELFGHVKDYLREHTERTGFVFETESPQSGSSVERKIRKDRLKFFVEAGARRLPRAKQYRAPDLSGSGFVDLMLMWVPFGQKTDGPTTEDLVAYVKAIYRLSYHLSLDDPRLKSVLNEMITAGKSGEKNADTVHFTGETT